MAALDPMARLEVIAEVGPEEEGTQIEEEWRAYCGAAADENSSEEEEEEETKKDDDEKACDDEIEGKIAAQLRASVRRHTELVEQSRTVQQREGAETEGRKSDAQTTVHDFAEDIGIAAEEVGPAVPLNENDAFWANSGVPIEPFNMNREREEGFFDQSGAYLFDPDEQDEAWLADAGDLDPDWVRRVTTRGKNFALEPGPGPASSAGGSAAPEAMAALLAEHLRPGETPIEALRRLGGVRERVSRKKAQFRDAQRTGRPGESSLGEMQRWVSEENKEKFESLTGLITEFVESTGDVGAYMRPREAIEASSRALVQTMARGGNSGGGVGREGTEAGNDRRGVKRKMEDAG